MADPKSQLCQFLTKYLGKNLSTGDIEYSSQKFPEGFQATVTLKCLQGQDPTGQAPEFAGEVGLKSKDAEKNAAQQALVAYAELIAQLETQPKKKGKKRPAAEMAGSELAGLASIPTGAVPGKTPLSKQQLKEMFGEVPPNREAMMTLNSALGKIMRRSMQTGELVYQVDPTEDGRNVATLTISCLPPPFGGHPFQGMPYAEKKDAQHSAAQAAFEAMSADPSLSVQMNAPKVQKPNPFAGKGKGDKGKGKSYKGGGGYNSGYNSGGGFGDSQGAASYGNSYNSGYASQGAGYGSKGAAGY